MLEGKIVFTLNDSDIFLCYQDLWKTSRGRENAVYQGICSEAVRRISIDAENIELKNVKKIKQLVLHIAIYFVFLWTLKYYPHTCPFSQYDIEDKLSYQLTFKSYGKVIVSSYTSATYSISDIHLEFDGITSPELAATLRAPNQGKQTILYDRVLEHEKRTLNKRDTTLNISLHHNVKGVLIFFIDPDDSDQLYDRDPEKF